MVKLTNYLSRSAGALELLLMTSLPKMRIQTVLHALASRVYLYLWARFSSRLVCMCRLFLTLYECLPGLLFSKQTFTQFVWESIAEHRHWSNLEQRIQILSFFLQNKTKSFQKSAAVMKGDVSTIYILLLWRPTVWASFLLHMTTATFFSSATTLCLFTALQINTKLGTRCGRSCCSCPAHVGNSV